MQFIINSTTFFSLQLLFTPDKQRKLMVAIGSKSSSAALKSVSSLAETEAEH